MNGCNGVNLCYGLVNLHSIYPSAFHACPPPKLLGKKRSSSLKPPLPVLVSFHNLKREEPILGEERTQQALRPRHLSLRRRSILLWNPVGSNKCFLKVGRNECLILRRSAGPIRLLLSNWSLLQAPSQPSCSFPSWIWHINQLSVILNTFRFKKHNSIK